ncbi:hypothetical protein BDV98DRAFT_8219 [Pterulicium gracile]|uniref:Uncharacterized protein n=1 Tax=Pterulicium gracile TaxID=1884261 RepID=A0A5C3QYK3_9AGAR|nr:hypothetical protein BDV98DRAFT_8219 [Pterula gracilis]
MTEYSTSASAIEEYMTSQQRLRNWLVQSPGDCSFYSPNIPTSTLPDPDYVPPPPSDIDSSHSEPPNMVLHWPDGRPDEPLREYSGDKPPPSPPLPGSSQGRGKSHASTKKSHTKSHSHPPRSRSSHAPTFPAPAQATIPAQSSLHPSHHSKLPASQARPSHRTHSTHTRSRSLPRPSDLPSMESASSPHGIVAPPVDLVPMGHASRSGLPQGTQYPPHPPHTHFPPAPNPMASVLVSSHLPSPPASGHVQFSSTPRGHFNTWSARSGNKSKHRPPAIIYAPSSHSTNYLYSPPMITPYHPSYPIPPGSVIYSHSAPNPPLAPAPWAAGPRYPAPYPSTAGTAVVPPSVTQESTSRPRRRRERDKSERREKHSMSHSPHHHHHHSRSPRSRSRSRGASATKVGGSHNGSDYSLVDAESDGSGSTYYILPAQGQKVLVIAPEHSILNKARLGPAPSQKKPLLQRLLNLREVFSSSGSSKGTSRPPGRRLHRRHSTDASNGGRPP